MKDIFFFLPMNSPSNQPWVFIGRTDAEAETPMFWSPDAKNWLIGKDPDAGKDWRQEEKGTTEDEMVRWHHQPQWTWVWVNSGSWWWTGRPGVLQSMGSQRVGHDWETELNWFHYCLVISLYWLWFLSFHSSKNDCFTHSSHIFFFFWGTYMNPWLI